MTGVGLASGQLVKLARQMVRGACVHVPCRVHRVRRSEPRLLCGESSLLLVTLPIVPNAKEITFEATMASRRQVPLNAAELTLNATTTCLAVEPLAASRRRWSGRTGLVA